MGGKLGGGKNGDITTNSKKNKKDGGMSFQNTLRLKNDNVRGGRLLSWIGPINWGQKIRVLGKGGENGRIDLGWRAMNRAIQLWRNRSGPKLGWGGALNSFSCFTATRKQTALGPSDGEENLENIIAKTK